MTFFIHQQAVAAIQFLYPDLKNNIDYIVIMKIDDKLPMTGNGGEPIEDCFIAEWRIIEHPQPTIDYLKQVYADNNLNMNDITKKQPTTTGTQTA